MCIAGSIRVRGAFFWIIVHQRSRWICDQIGFIGSFDALWSEWSWITDPDSDHPKGTHPKFCGDIKQSSKTESNNDLCCCFCLLSGSCPDDFKVYRTDGRSRLFQTVSSGEILQRLQNRSVRCYSCVIRCLTFWRDSRYDPIVSLFKAHHFIINQSDFEQKYDARILRGKRHVVVWIWLDDKKTLLLWLVEANLHVIVSSTNFSLEQTDWCTLDRLFAFFLQQTLHTGLFSFAGAIYEGTTNIQLSTIAKNMTEFEP